VKLNSLTVTFGVVRYRLCDISDKKW